MQTKQPRRGGDLTQANAKRYRKADERHAQRMRSRGWVVIPPEEASRTDQRTE